MSSQYASTSPDILDLASLSPIPICDSPLVPGDEMGNICSKSANKDDNFSSPGRVLGANSDAPHPVGVPAPQQKRTVTTPGRTLGSAGGDRASSPDDARTAAARAAEERAAAKSKAGGKLSASLAAQKKQTQNQTLNAGSEQERLARTADANAETRNWN